MCKAIFGDDTKVLTEDENLNTFFIEELNSVLKKLVIQKQNMKI